MPSPAILASIKDASAKLSAGRAPSVSLSPASLDSSESQSAQSLIDQSKRIRAEKRVPVEQYQEELADFYHGITLNNPNWRAQEKQAADIGKLALEKVKIAGRLHIDTKPAPPQRTIRTQTIFADGKTDTKIAVVTEVLD